MENSLLTICIITYNRSVLVEKSIQEFINQCRPFNIPICVSDNSDNNKTALVVEALQKEYPYIYYKQNINNLGFDGNVVSVIEMANTKYCWLFGDDDLIVPNTIQKVMEVLAHNYGLIVVNASTHTSDLSKVVASKHWKIDTDQTYKVNEFEKVFSDLVLYTSFIGSLIVERKWWNTIKPDKYFKTGFVHVGVVFEYIINTSAYFISEPLIKIRLGNSGWSKNSFKIWYVHWVSVIKSLPYYAEDVKKKVIRTPDTYNVKFLMAERAKKYYNKQIYLDIIKGNKDISSFKKGLFYLISVSPVGLWRSLLKSYLLVFKPNLYEYQLHELDLNALETDYL